MFKVTFVTLTYWHYRIHIIQTQRKLLRMTLDSRFFYCHSSVYLRCGQWNTMYNEHNLKIRLCTHAYIIKCNRINLEDLGCESKLTFSIYKLTVWQSFGMRIMMFKWCPYSTYLCHGWISFVQISVLCNAAFKENIQTKLYKWTCSAANSRRLFLC